MEYVTFIVGRRLGAELGAGHSFRVLLLFFWRKLSGGLNVSKQYIYRLFFRLKLNKVPFLLKKIGCDMPQMLLLLIFPIHKKNNNEILRPPVSMILQSTTKKQQFQIRKPIIQVYNP